MSNDYYNAVTQVTKRTTARAADINAERAAVAAAFDLLPGKDELNQDRATYVADAGTANTYVVTLSPTPGSYVAGLTMKVKFANANTGACTINVNSLGARSIKRQGGDDPSVGEIGVGDVLTLTYDGTNFQITSASRATFATTPVSSAMVGFPSPAQFRFDLAPVMHNVSHIDGVTPSGSSTHAADNTGAIQDWIDWAAGKTYGGTLCGPIVHPDYVAPQICINDALQFPDKVGFQFYSSDQFKLTSSADYMIQTKSDGSLSQRRHLVGGWWDANQNAGVAGIYLRHAKAFVVERLHLDKADAVGILIGQATKTSGGEVMVRFNYLRNGQGGYSHASGSTGIKTTGVALNDSDIYRNHIVGYDIGIDGTFYDCHIEDHRIWSYGGSGGPGHLSQGIVLQSGSEANQIIGNTIGQAHTSFIEDKGAMNDISHNRFNMIDSSDVPTTGTVYALDLSASSGGNVIVGNILREVDANVAGLIDGTITAHEVYGNKATNTAMPAASGGMRTDRKYGTWTVTIEDENGNASANTTTGEYRINGTQITLSIPYMQNIARPVGLADVNEEMRFPLPSGYTAGASQQARGRWAPAEGITLTAESHLFSFIGNSGTYLRLSYWNGTSLVTVPWGNFADGVADLQGIDITYTIPVSALPT